MIEKSIPKETIIKAVKKYKTPFYIYFENELVYRNQRIIKKFSNFLNHHNYYPIKALSNPQIIKILKLNGSYVECSSYPELIIAKSLGFKGDEIIFTSNNATPKEINLAVSLDSFINIDDIDFFISLLSTSIIPSKVIFRVNPGQRITINTNFSPPIKSQFGIPYERILESVKLAASTGIKTIGLHAMLTTNSLDHIHFVNLYELLFNLIETIWLKEKIKISIINIGGGIGIPYHQSQNEFNLDILISQINTINKKTRIPFKNEIVLQTEFGRYISGPCGFFVCRVLQIKESYRTYAYLDSSINNFMRTAFFKSYNHITVLSRKNVKNSQVYTLVGSLCDTIDIFAEEIELPRLDAGDIIVFHDVGAHAFSMSFNYNSSFRCKEILCYNDNDLKLIRREETCADLFSTLVLDESIKINYS